MSSPRPYGAQRACRKLLRARDKGICCTCGLDTIETRLEFAAAYRKRKKELIDQAMKSDPSLSLRSLSRSKAILQAARLAPRCVEIKLRTNLPWKALVSRRTLWEAHHVVAVSEGGSLLDGGNLATYCLCCHAKETARQTRERAGRKRRGEAISVGGPPLCSPIVPRTQRGPGR